MLNAMPPAGEESRGEGAIVLILPKTLYSSTASSPDDGHESLYPANIIGDHPTSQARRIVFQELVSNFVGAPPEGLRGRQKKRQVRSRDVLLKKLRREKSDVARSCSGSSNKKTKNILLHAARRFL
jgi:hypothetical protein